MLTSVVAGTWSTEGVWTPIEDAEQPYSVTQTFCVNTDGVVYGRELLNGKIIKYQGALPPDAQRVVYGERAFKYWTVADAEAFENGEAVDPWLPKSNMTKRGN
jgi:hypothetical protein